MIGNQAIKPMYQISAASMMTTCPMLQNGSDQAGGSGKQQKGEIKDNIKYEIKFKNLDVKKIFKDFYSLYGPLFIACHIGISLVSLGFFYGLVYTTVDVTAILPSYFVEKIGHKIASATGAGGQFVVAYAAHKVMLPIRLLLAIGLTRFISRTIQARRAARAK